MRSLRTVDTLHLPFPLLLALRVAVFEVVSVDRLKLLSDAPPWLTAIWPRATRSRSLGLESRFVFLSSFAGQAIGHWKNGQREPLESERWTELDAQGIEYVFKATAVHVNRHPLLLVQPSTVDQAAFRTLLQEGRNLALDHHQLRKSIADREVLLHCIAHDLSTPLAGIRASLKLLRTDNLVNAAGEELIDLGLRQIDKLQRLTRDILSSVSAPLQTGADTDVPQLVSEVVANLEPLAAERNVSINVKTDVSSLFVATDALHLERVLFNLLDNALRHAPPETTITLQFTEQSHAVRFRIVDEGDGVPAELHERLFERHTQGQDLRGQAGLGLYFCKIAVEGWGGRIGYEPGHGGGACFWFTLPYTATPAPDGPTG